MKTVYIYIYLTTKKQLHQYHIPSPTNRGSGPPLLWPLMTRNYVISVLTTTPKFISTREALLLLLHPLKKPHEYPRKRKLLKKKVTRVGKVIDWAKNHRQLSLSSRLF